MTAHVCGIDIGKTVFNLIGLNKEGHIVVKARFSRKQLITHTVNMLACLVGMEACPGPTFSRTLRFETCRHSHLFLAQAFIPAFRILRLLIMDPPVFTGYFLSVLPPAAFPGKCFLGSPLGSRLALDRLRHLEEFGSGIPR